MRRPWLSPPQPGATVFVSAALTEYGQPMTSSVSVRAEIKRPDDTNSVIALSRQDQAFEGSFVSTQAGVYHVRILAEGTTRRGRPFARETTRTAVVWQGGDQPRFDPRGPRNPGRRWCEIVTCLRKQKSIVELLRRLRIDPAELARCLPKHCKRDLRRQQVISSLRNLIADGGGRDVIESVLEDLGKQQDD